MTEKSKKSSGDDLTNATDEQIVDWIFTVEAHPDNAWGRTGAIPRKGSSAWGPLQITETRIKDLSKLPLSPEEQGFVERLEDQGAAFLKYGVRGIGMRTPDYMNHPTREALVEKHREFNDKGDPISWNNFLKHQYTQNPNITDKEEKALLGVGTLQDNENKKLYADVVRKELISSWNKEKKKNPNPTYKNLARVWHGGDSEKLIDDYRSKIEHAISTNKVRDFNSIIPSTEDTTPEGAPIVSEEELDEYNFDPPIDPSIVTDKELDEYTPGSDSQKMQNAISSLKGYPEKYPDDSEMRKKAAIDALQIEASDERLEDILDMSPEEFLAEGRSVAETSPALLPADQEETSESRDMSVEEYLAEDYTPPEVNEAEPEVKQEETPSVFPGRHVKEPPPRSDVSQGDAAALGWLTGGTFGYVDELMGAAAWLGGDDYTQMRDTVRAEQKAAEEAWPKTYKGMEFGGGMVTGVAVPGSLFFKGKSALQAAKGTAAIGAVEGGIGAVGYSEGETVIEVAAHAVVGIVFGAVVGGAVGGLVRGLSNRVASNRATRQAALAGDDVATIVERAETKAVVNADADRAAWKTVELINPKLLADLPEAAKKAMGEEYKELANSVVKTWNPARGEEIAYLAGEISDSQQHFLQTQGQGHLIDAAKIDMDTIVLNEWRTYMTRYMEYVTETAAKAKIKTAKNVTAGLYDPPVISEGVANKLWGAFEQAKKAGKVTEDSWAAFKRQEYLADAIVEAQEDFITRMTIKGGMTAEQAAEEWTKKFSAAPLGRARKFLDANIAFRMIDDKAELDLEMVNNRLYQANNIKTGFDRELIEFHSRRAMKLRKKTNMTDDELIAGMEGRTSFQGAKAEVVEAYRDSYEYLLIRSREEGLPVESLGRNYVPLKKKLGAEAVLAFEDYYKNNSSLIRQSGDILGELAEKTDDEIVDLVENEYKDVSKREVALFFHYLKQHMGRDSLSLDEIQGVFDSGILRTKIGTRAANDPTVAAVYTRKGMIPDFLRQKNVDSLLFSNVDQTSKSVFLQPLAKELDSRIAVLNELGFKAEADYVWKYRMDVVGAYRGSYVNKAENFGNIYKMWAHDKGFIAQAAPDLANLMGQAIYANLVGANARTVFRNAVQPFTMTVPEMGWLYGTKHAFGAYKDMAIKMNKGGWAEVMDEVENIYHLKPVAVRAEDYEGIRGGIETYAKGKMHTTRAAVTAYANVVLSLFTKTDELNRAVTLEMSKRMAKDVMQGFGDTKHITEGTKKALLKLPNALRRAVLKLQKEATPKAERQITELLGRHYVVGTQLAYGKVGMHELGRDLGPFMSMLTKWQVGISSQVYYEIQKDAVKGSGTVARKFLAPIIAAGLITRMVLDTEDPMVQKFIGKDGFMGWMSGWAMFDVPSIIVPVNVETPLAAAKQLVTFAGKAASGISDDRDTKALGKMAKRMTQQYVPILGGAWRAHDNLVLPFMEDK